MESLDRKAAAKILYNIDLAEKAHDSKLFKKLNKNIWEFRTRFGKAQYRLFAFWDNDEKTGTLVIATHGIIKKDKKISPKEIRKAESIMNEYFNNK